MIILHHLNQSRSHRIIWLLEELKLPYEIKRYERDKKTMLAPQSLKAVHPLGKSPVITDGERVVAESGAIVEYLVEKYAPSLKPGEESEKLRFNYWLHYAEGSAMMPLLLNLIFTKIENSPMPFFVRPVAKKIAQNVRSFFISPQLKLHFDFMESELAKSTWFAGESFSAADIIMSFPIESAEGLGLLKIRPNLLTFLEKIRSRPAYQRAHDASGE